MISIYGDPGGECKKLLESIAGIVQDRDKALQEWEKEEKTTPDQEVKKLVQPRRQWAPKDRDFLKLLIKKSMETAAEAAVRNDHSIKDIFLGQVTRLEEELKDLDSRFPPVTNPVPNQDYAIHWQISARRVRKRPKKATKKKRRKR